MSRIDSKKASRLRRKMRIRGKVHGTAERPRLLVVRSLKHISAALVDDDRGVTLTGVMDNALESGQLPLPKPGGKDKKDAEQEMSGRIADAYRVGMAIAAKAKERGIEKVVFDRNGLRYHGRVRACAEGARKGGLDF